jgi:hypothetical protein
MPNGKPYHFEATYAVQDAIDLGRRIAAGEHGLKELKDACGIAGCALEKHDGEPDAFGAAPSGRPVNLDNLSLKKLGERLEKKAEESATTFGADGDGTEEAGNPAIWLPIILAIAEKLLARWRKK